MTQVFGPESMGIMFGATPCKVFKVSSFSQRRNQKLSKAHKEAN